MAKTKLNQELIKTAAKYVALGTPVKYICDALIINESTWYSWYNKGKENDDDRTLEVKFYKSIKKSKGDLIARNLKHIEQAADNGTWQAAAWKLERLDFENFGRKEKHEHSGKIKQEIDYSAMDNKQLIEECRSAGMTDEEIVKLLGD